jgi:phospholipid/cholesterol/gamma-HCH transport system permease protein
MVKMSQTSEPGGPPVDTLPAYRNWSVRQDGSRAIVALSGNWIAREGGVANSAPAEILQAASGRPSLAFDVSGLGSWDSALIAFLRALRQTAHEHGLAFDDSGLPTPARRLLTLVSDEPAPAPERRRRTPLLLRAGNFGLRAWAELVAVADLLGESILRGGAALRGRAKMRWVDLLECAREAGAGALPIVATVNFLVGGILAFVGAVQLQKFGAEVFVADLVGIAIVREMAAIMTAIVMAGRTGGAYAAQIATMQGNEEIDALRATGIPVPDYLILPRVTALTGMMPVLYLYGSAIGILGGFVVAVSVLDLTSVQYFEHTRSALSLTQFAIGITKSITFGALVAIASCRIGLRAGRSAADVGRAATSAVVVGIVGIIAADAVFAVCTNALGI